MFEGNEIGQTASVYFGDVFTRNNYITEIVGLRFYHLNLLLNTHSVYSEVTLVKLLQRLLKSGL